MPSKVVLPAPLAPSSPETPRCTVNDAPSSAVVVPHLLTTPWPLMMVSALMWPRWYGPGHPFSARTARRRRIYSRDRSGFRIASGAMADTRVKIRSNDVTEGFRKAPARAMLRAIGMTDDDWVKPQVAVASSWNEVTPCNMPLARLAKRSKEGVRAAGGFPIEFTTIAVSDGISMGHEGMRGSLVSREIIADSIECMMHAERFDGLVTFAGCDKSLPGMLMAAARVNLPSVFLYGGSILPGHYKDQALDMLRLFA